MSSATWHARTAMARAALRCSDFAAAPNSLRSLRSLRSDKRREVSCGCALTRAPQSPALLSSSEGGDEHQIRLASHRHDAHLALRADAKRGVDRESSRSERPYCSWAPWEASRSAGVWGRVRSTLRQLTSRGCLSAAAKGREASSARGPKHRAPQSSPALAGPPPSGRLSFGSFSLAKQRKGTALSGAHPDAASRSAQPQRKREPQQPTLKSPPPAN